MIVGRFLLLALAITLTPRGAFAQPGGESPPAARQRISFDQLSEESKALYSICEETEKAIATAKVAEKRKVLAVSLQEGARNLTRDYPNLFRAWTWQAQCALVLNEESEARNAAKNMKELGALSSGSPQILAVVKLVDERVWNAEKEAKQDDGAILAEYKAATVKINDWADGKLKEFETEEEEVNGKIDAARIAFSNAKEDKIREIEAASKNVADQVKSTRQALDDYKARGASSQTISSAKGAIAEGKRQQRKYAEAVEAVRAKTFESSDNYQKAEQIISGDESGKRKVEKERAAQITRLSAAYSAKLLQSGQ